MCGGGGMGNTKQEGDIFSFGVGDSGKAREA